MPRIGRNDLPTPVERTDDPQVTPPRTPATSVTPTAPTGWQPRTPATPSNVDRVGFDSAPRRNPVAPHVGRPLVQTRVAHPAKTLHPQDFLPVSQRFDRVALDDGRVDASDVNQLIHSLAARPLSPEDEQAARTSFERLKSRFTPTARARMETFFARQVPRLRTADSGSVGVGVRRDGLGAPTTATANWDPPTTSADGTPLTDLAGYKLYYGSTPGTYTNVIDIRDPSATGYVVEGLTQGPWYFAVTAYDTSGNESGHSNEASKVIP
ncbi:MAG: hypothetical protein ACOZIN_11280 [Myxococcota bacterium]